MRYRRVQREINSILEKNRKPKLLPWAVPYYEREDSRVPEQVRISFNDGTSAVYVLKVDQPAPLIMENIRIIRKWKNGYINQPTRRRGRA